MNLTKKQLVANIATATALTQVAVREVIQRTFDAIIDAVSEVGRLELRNFGVFEVRFRRRRMARNPRTGAAVEVPSKFIVSMTPGRAWRERVNAHPPRSARRSGAPLS